MKKIVIISMIMMIMTCLSAVTWQIALYDSYGDGWNGGMITVFVNGSAVLTDITLSNGYGPEYHNISIANGDELTTDYTQGSYSSENEYQIIDHNGNVVAIQGADDESPGDITTPLVASIIAGTPDPASNPNPAHQATNVPINGNLSWDFGADTDAYDLWFGPTGSMVQVVDGEASGASGSFAYNDLPNNAQYSWRVDTINNTSGITSPGPVWTFATALPEGLVEIGSGSVTGYNLPLNPYYGYNYSQTIYLQSEINVSGQRIEKLYYNWNGLAAGTNTKDWTIYMGHTDKTAFSSTTDWVPFADLTAVFSGIVTLPASAGWVEIILTTPFTYNNTGNLVIAVNENTPGDDGSLAKFFGTSFATNRGLRRQNDSSAYNPASPGTGTRESGIGNVRLQFGEIPTVPTFAYSPASLTFNNVVSGTSSGWQNVTVINNGQGTLDLYASDLSLIGTNASDFEFDASNLPTALTAGQSETIPVRFNAPGIGSYSATLRMNYEGTDYDVALTGIGVAPFVNMSNGSTTLAVGEVWNFYDSGGVSGQYASSENFTYTFNPPDGYRCIVEFTTFNTETNYDFLKLYDGIDNSGTLIGNYSGTTVPASYTSITTGSLTFVFTSDGSGVRDGWAATISSEELPDVPILSHSPTSIAFPITKAGESSAAQNVTVTNTGGSVLILNPDDISIDGMTGDFDFSTENLPANLSTGQSVTIPVFFTPQNAGDFTATLLINYESVNYQVALTGTAYPDTYVFEGFEGASFPPAGWANPGSWSKSTSTYFEGTGSAYKYGYSLNPYILSTPKFEIASGDRLMFMGRVSSTTATLDIIYSLDRSDWTILQTLTAPTANSWLQVDVDLSPIVGSKTGVGYYLGFRANSTYVSYYIDNVIMPPYAQEAPEAVTLVAPADVAANIGLLPTLSWTPAATGGIPTSYDIYLEANDNTSADPTTLLTNVAASPYTLTTALEYSTTYIWKVVAKNAVGDAPASAVRSFTTMADPTVSSFPYVVDFSSWPVTDWTQQVGLYPNPTGSGSQWERDDWLNGPSGNNAAKINIYGTTRYGWLVTPPINIPGANYQVKFDAALLDWNDTFAPSTTQDDDRFMVLMSDNPDMSSSTILREWNNTGSEWVFNDIPADGETYIINLAGVTGVKYFAFYGESTVSGNGDNDFMIDNVTIKGPDYPEGISIVVGDDTITVSNGSANNVPDGVIPAIPNGTFVAAGSFVLELLGSGPWTVTIETDAPWGAYFKDGAWTAVENVGGFITFDINADKSLTTPIILGPVDPTLPVTLSSFTAVLTADMHVNLTWVAETEVDHAGYNVLRSEVKELSTAIFINTSLIDEGQNVGTQVKYNFLDKEVYHNAVYYYWLENVDLNGETEYYGPITAYVNADGEGPGIPEIPLETKLFAAFPNPFNPATNLRYSMKEAGDVRIDVFNVKGQILKTYHNSHNLPGYYQVNWDGRDLNGRPVSTGVYFYRMTSGNYSSTKKMVMAK